MSDSGGGPGAPGDETGGDEPSRSGGAGPSNDAGRSDDASRSDPPPRRDDGRDVPSPTEAPLRWYVRSRDPLVVASRDVLTSVLLVLLVGLTLFSISGVWPPMVAVESGSMEPNMHQGDLVIVVEEDRFTSASADEHGVVTQDDGARAGHERFGQPGSVVVYQPDGRDRTPIIHRAAFYVEEGEDWVDRADPEHLGGVDSCREVPHDNCPAPHDGYITRGDANAQYDQIAGQSTVVHEEWVNGRAVARIPYLGCIRLELSESPSCREDR